MCPHSDDISSWNLVVFLAEKEREERTRTTIEVIRRQCEGREKSSFCNTKDEMMMKKKREKKENYKGSSVGSLRLKFITMIGFFQLKKFQIY
jgi:hypothetical protein